MGHVWRSVQTCLWQSSILHHVILDSLKTDEFILRTFVGMIHVAYCTVFLLLHLAFTAMPPKNYGDASWATKRRMRTLWSCDQSSGWLRRIGTCSEKWQYAWVCIWWMWCHFPQSVEFHFAVFDADILWRARTLHEGQSDQRQPLGSHEDGWRRVQGLQTNAGLSQISRFIVFQFLSQLVVAPFPVVRAKKWRSSEMPTAGVWMEKRTLPIPSTFLPGLHMLEGLGFACYRT